MAEQLGWREAIRQVLQNHSEAMHYVDIAEEIKEKGLRTSFGATPANTVNVYISDSLNNEGESSPFDRVSRGYYRLREANVASLDATPTNASNTASGLDGDVAVAESVDEPAGLINALRMYWSREKVIWSSTPRLYGNQIASDELVDLSDQRGVYLLYDRNSVVYVGRTTDQGIGTRLRQHTFDRLNGRWDRFSWFGIYPIAADGSLVKDTKAYGASMLIATMEALLIEAVEPAQNRRRGDDFRAVEFLQALDPEIERNNLIQQCASSSVACFPSSELRSIKLCEEESSWQRRRSALSAVVVCMTCLA